MSNKYRTFSLQMKDELREQLENKGRELKFVQPSGAINLGKTIRYLLVVGLNDETILTAAELSKLL